MLRDQSLRLHAVLVGLDVAGGMLLFLGVALWQVPGWVAAAGGARAFGLEALPLLAVAGLAWPLMAGQLGLYDSQRRRSLTALTGRLLLAGAVSTALLTAVVFAVSEPLPLFVPLVAGLAQAACLTLIRLGIHLGLRTARRYGRNYRNVLMVGTGPRAADVRRRIERHPEWGLRIVGYVDDADVPIEQSIPADSVHKLVDIQSILRDEIVDEVIVACPRSMLGSLGPVVAVCADAGVPFTMLTDLFGDHLPPPRVTRFDDYGALSFAPVHHNAVKLAVKRALDITGAGTGLLLAAPALALAAFAIRATSKGPVLFRQVRCGLNGRRFEITKLRTMCVDAEAQLEDVLHLNQMDGPVFKATEDPRVTRVGRWLRRYSLDEIPQLLNVIKGDMSLVGPRPALPHEVAQYEMSERRRLSMRPGLTCLWQVGGRNDLEFEEWVRLDIEYIDTWSLRKDLAILLRTIPTVLRGTGV
jgi:exopolysaccharide biosynthesis polyprenyl glycosylphosphotransferase